MDHPRLSPRSLTRPGLCALLGAGAFTLACVVDRAVFLAVSLPKAQGQDWHRALRVLGYVPTWLVAALGLALSAGLFTRPAGASNEPARRRAALGAVYLALAPLASGAVAELAKLLIRRERPEPHDGRFVFRPFTDEPFSTSGLGLPSSHSMVAFGAAFALCRLFPRAAPLWIALGAGCGVTRVIDRDHFLSDVVLAMALAFGTAWTLARVLRVPGPWRDPGAHGEIPA